MTLVGALGLGRFDQQGVGQTTQSIHYLVSGQSGRNSHTGRLQQRVVRDALLLTEHCQRRLVLGGLEHGIQYLLGHDPVGNLLQGRHGVDYHGLRVTQEGIQSVHVETRVTVRLFLLGYAHAPLVQHVVHLGQ